MDLRSRLILSFILIILVCLGVIAAFAAVTAVSSLDRLAASRLNDKALPIFIQVRALLRGQANLDQVWPSIQEQAEANDLIFYLYDSKGNLIKKTSENDTSGGPPQTLFSRTQVGIRPLRADFTGEDGKTYLCAAFSFSAYPRITNTSGAEWFVVSTSLSSTETILSDLIRPLLLAGLAALVFSVIMAFFLARSVYKPVSRVKEAAALIAAGKYDQKVPVEGPWEVRELAASFNEMAKQVKSSQQTLRDFVADVSHELRTPLTSIMGFAQALHDGTAQSQESVIKASGIIDEESQRMIRLVNNLLELSRLESGQLRIKKEEVDLKEVIEQAREIFDLRTEEKGLFLITDLEPLPPVLGDIDRLEQVFANLLDNAIKHSIQESTITIRGRHPSPDTVEISVIDTGPGMTAEQMAHAFERFYHGEGQGERSGTGLGLAIARQIALSHGGDIRVSSQPGKGSEFIVRLPAMDQLKYCSTQIKK
ncbi:MAG: HAMP domain-containing histidine kinase [Dehalococcoidia bacterium]|nr:HAMP domain-containing histidine kinase [Dehalococcoidia bacterium]